MCIVKTPKPIDPKSQKPKDPTVIRNRYLDGVGPDARAARTGRSSLRITRARNAPATPRPSPVPTAPQPGPSPVQGGGGYGGRVGSGGRIGRITTNAY